MCGIAGMINHANYDLQQLMTSLKHRGPDEQQLYVENRVALIHTRLAIQDVAHGKQPFTYGDFTIIFNGEIYNHLKLRQHLNEFHFKTNCDTETLLFLYIKYKEKMFAMIDGMFAFCVYDRLNNLFFLARDRSGKKPLYYQCANDSFIFASELNAIKSITHTEINSDAIHCFLRAGFIYKHYTPYQQIVELEAGHCLTVQLNDLNMQQHAFYSILENYQQQNQQLPFNDAVLQVEEELLHSIKNRLVTSDVEVGAFLSGGIDSNLIVAMASKIHPGLKTFTVKFAQGYDESGLAALAAKHYQTDHTEIEIEMDLDNDIERILTSYGEPFMDSSAVPSFYVAREARKHVKVILNGDGADELFGGYRRYVAIANNLPQLAKNLAGIRRFLPKPKQKSSLYNFLYRLLSLANKQGLDFYLSSTFDIYEDIFSFNNNAITDEMNEFVLNTLNDEHLTSLSKMLYLDFNLLLFSDLLVKMDIATMANSLEGRSPFLSQQLLNLAPTLPDHFKVKKLTTKYILREIAKKHLPTQLIHQPKRGFEVPLKKWVDETLKSKIYDSLAPGCYAENFIQRTFIQQLLDQQIDIPQEKRAKILWGLFCLEVWHRNEQYACAS